MAEPARSTDIDGDRPRVIEIVLPAVARSVTDARHAVAALLAGVPSVPDVVVDDILLLVSELVTNAVLHARTDTRVSASVELGRVSVAVADGDPRNAPFLAERGSLATNGRGVMLVDALSTDWGIDVEECSKVVWFEAAYDVDGIVGGLPRSLGAGPLAPPRARPPRRPGRR
ncbi:MAG: ATP-binding protein [Acidimicrobiales bacterium]